MCVECESNILGCGGSCCRSFGRPVCVASGYTHFSMKYEVQGVAALMRGCFSSIKRIFHLTLCLFVYLLSEHIVVLRVVILYETGSTMIWMI
jgi:hypothetical protein